MPMRSLNGILEQIYPRNWKKRRLLQTSSPSIFRLIDSRSRMKRTCLIIIMAGFAAVCILISKIGEHWVDSYVESQVQTRLKDYDDLRKFKQQSQDVFKRLRSAIDNAWKEKPHKDDRELMSKRLNVLAMELNQYMCELQDAVSFAYAKENSVGNCLCLLQITSTGGWCGKHFKEGHMTDEPLAARLSQFLKGEAVGSFGDGPGTHLIPICWQVLKLLAHRSL